MEGINHTQRSSYSATKKGAILGAGVGTLAGAGIMVSNVLGNKTIASARTFAEKKLLLTGIRDTLELQGKDLSHTTISRVTKSLAGKNALKKFAVYTAIGTAIGLVIDVKKRHSAHVAPQESDGSKQ